jgi:prevent-host-death family protein
MPRIGLRELKIHASEVLRDVQENRARYVITKRGDPQAIIIPCTPAGGIRAPRPRGGMDPSCGRARRGGQELDLASHRR